MKKLLLVIVLLVAGNCYGQHSERELKTVTFEGSGYELGLQHGKELKSEIILNLLDEFWVYVNNLSNHHCSSLGIPATVDSPGYISQNMDLEDYTDGFQVLMRLKRTENSPEQLILTYPGLIGLNGLNEKGLGVVVNTLMQLNAANTGLPVAFVIRRLLNSTDKEEMLDFINKVKHASGQNYILGIRGEVYDFEASTNKVVRYNPENENGSVYHTNHPMVNDDIKPWFEKFNPKSESKPTQFNSYYRFQAVEKRIAKATNFDENLIMGTLRSKDDADNPVCRSNSSDGGGFTFASTIMKMADKPYMLITAGPPDQSEYKRFDFSE